LLRRIDAIDTCFTHTVAWRLTHNGYTKLNYKGACSTLSWRKKSNLIGGL